MLKSNQLSCSLDSAPILLLILVLFFPLGCSNKEPSHKKESSLAATETVGSNFVFTNVTEQLSLKHRFENGEESGERSILETIGGGVAVLDFDMDGFEDLCMASGGLLENKTVTGRGVAVWRSRSAKQFYDCTALAGVNCSSIYTHSTISGDFNNDGFPDLLITGYFGIALLVNQGDGTFLNCAAEAGLVDPSWGTSAALGDFDSDGSLDIYIAHYVNWSFSNHPDCTSGGKSDVCAPGNFTGISDVIWMSQSDGTFARKSSEIGLVPEGKGLGVIVADFTQDSKVDIYVANDTTNNFFYLNQGGKFEEIGLANGTAVNDMGTPEGSMGLCTMDYDSDLKLDIMVSNYENQAFALYKNDGESNFRYVTSTAGLMALGKTYVAWGSTARDFDLDGDEDIAVANGHVMKSNPPEQLPLFLENLGNGKFSSKEFSQDSYFARKWRGRGLAAFDLEKDGDLDLVVTHVNEDAVVLANDTKSDGQWWNVKLIGTVSSRDPIGASLVIETNRRKILRSIVGGGSYLSQGPYSIHWGLPKGESLKSIEIVWPSQRKQVVEGLSPNSFHVIVEPAK